MRLYPCPQAALAHPSALGPALTVRFVLPRVLVAIAKPVVNGVSFALPALVVLASRVSATAAERVITPRLVFVLESATALAFRDDGKGGTVADSGAALLSPASASQSVLWMSSVQGGHVRDLLQAVALLCPLLPPACVQSTVLASSDMKLYVRHRQDHAHGAVQMALEQSVSRLCAVADSCDSDGNSLCNSPDHADAVELYSDVASAAAGVFFCGVACKTSFVRKSMAPSLKNALDRCVCRASCRVLCSCVAVVTPCRAVVQDPEVLIGAVGLHPLQSCAAAVCRRGRGARRVVAR